MKIRTGFVSNSSSSSFIVKNREEFPFGNNNEPKLTKNEIKLLEDYGFFRVRRPYASELEARKGVAESYNGDYNLAYNFGYWVVSNQGEVITFLLKHKIPFTASTQYGHTHIFYDRGDEFMLIAENFGLNIEMYGYRRENHGNYGVRKLNVKKYLKAEAHI